MVVYTRIHLVIVSIHTPTQGVTTPCWIPGRPIRFQSTHPRRVWLWKEGYERCWLRFQSTHPRRVWQESTSLSDSSNLFQSTHPRRVWLLSMLRFTYKDVSIHTPTQGVTHLRLPQRLIPMFQSTHPRRVWPDGNIGECAVDCFNPHTHAGCDGMDATLYVSDVLFQSTHPRRVWRKVRQRS